ncbi:MAG: AI-2E family transporter [Acidimicrobiia bacterium]|nr:AI-2E family transporter [Acidimicrobiia bacterium]
METATPESAAPPEPIPVRHYFAFWSIGVLVVGVVLACYAVLAQFATVLGLVAVSGFLAIALGPTVGWCERRLHLSRGFATLVVFFLGLLLISALVYSFARPIYDASSTFTEDLPRAIRDAERGKGQLGRWLSDVGAQEWAKTNLPKLRNSLTDSNGLLAAGESLVTGTVAALTIAVLTFLMLLQGPSIGAFLVELFPYRRGERLRRVAADAGRAVTGYMIGNLAISLIAGIAIYIWLRALFIPFALVLALWVAFADMLPLVGATLGAIPPIFVALLKSPGLGLATLIFLVVYQLFENHVLQTTIMARAVKLNALGVLLSVLVGVELAGLLGALLAIPVAGALQVVARDIWQERRETVQHVLSRGAEPTPADPI